MLEKTGKEFYKEQETCFDITKQTTCEKCSVKIK